jgi:hypothetical protein
MGRRRDLRRVFRGLRPRHLIWNVRQWWRRANGCRVVLLEVQQPRDWDFLGPLFRALLARPGNFPVVLVNDRARFAGGLLHTAKELAQILERDGVPRAHIAANLGPRVWLGDLFLAATVWDNLLPMRRGILRGALPHGLVNKVDQYGRHMQRFDVLLAPGPLAVEQARASMARSGVDYEIWPVGYPKLDGLIGSAGTASVAARRPSRVIFAPSWGTNTTLDRYGLEPVDAMIRAGIPVIVKLHPMTLQRRAADDPLCTGAGDWAEELRRYDDEPLVTIAEGDSAPWLLEAAVLVSDVSGIAYEFLLMDKPVVFLDTPEYFDADDDVDHAWRAQDLCCWGREAGDLVQDVDEMVAAVLRALADPTNGHEKRRVLAERLLFHPDRAAQAFVNLVEERLPLRRARIAPRASARREGQ